MAKVVDMQVFYPAQLFDIGELDRVINNSLQETAEAVKVDLSAITRSWKHRPGFMIEKGQYWRRIHANDSNKPGQVFEMLNAGVDHEYPITARNAPRLAFRREGFMPKTAPRQLTSGPGRAASGPIYRPLTVMHPGYKAREWYETVTEKWQEELPVQMQRAIDSAVDRMGKKQVVK